METTRKVIRVFTWRGLTIDDLDKVPAVIVAIKSVPFRVIVRLVIDSRPLKDYDNAVKSLAAVCDVMVQVRDSYEEEQNPLSIGGYLQLFEDMLRRWKQWVSLWEIGNEVNGNWLPADIAQKVRSCATAAKTAGVHTAVTFYLERAGAMAEWAKANAITCDFALISWYPRANNGFVPDWETEASALAVACGGAMVGGGEFGTEDERGHQLAQVGTAKLIREINPLGPRQVTWVGGWFFWDFCKMCLGPKGRGCFNAWVESFLEKALGN